MIVVDSFMFFNELDLLEGRFEYLYDHVDYFLLVEAPLTQSGHVKPMHFMNNMTRYKKYLDKVIYFPFICKREDFEFDRLPEHDRDYNTGPWQVENGQRNHITKALDLFPDDAVIMISDLDEIPNTQCIPIAKDYFSKGWQALAVQQDHYAYNFNQRRVTPILGTTISTNRYTKIASARDVHNHRYGHGVITNGGWHLSYWGNADQIRYKIETFAHQELNQDKYKNTEHILNKIKNGQDMFDRTDYDNNYVKVRPEEIPEDIRRIFGKVHDKLVSQYD